MEIRSKLCIPEVWGGLECTINRVEGTYRDQLDLSGYYRREGDLAAVASLGISKVRYPVLWERHQPDGDRRIKWDNAARDLRFLEAANIDPIAGLLHHGSGPEYTDLLDVDFAKKFSAYAFEVAKQFPWLQYYTPVNEPMTTARFSGLYGFWYPHHREELSFIRMLLNQLKGTVLAMEAIRTINPDAALIQTEDLGKTHASPVISYQADFENERRWLTNDLLTGRVNRDHPFWNYFLELGIDQTDLEFFLEHKCAPQILGFNYYVTSERFLDADIERYPQHLIGGNGQHAYVDTEMVRRNNPAGVGCLLREAWDRYQLPMAITECHLNCTREEQLRWFKQTWDEAVGLKEDGIDIRAVTAWSLFGAHDWDSLLIENNGNYESGIFDTSSGELRPTQLARMIKSLAESGEYTHPLLQQRGWWARNQSDNKLLNGGSFEQPFHLLIIADSKILGKELKSICEQRGIAIKLISPSRLLSNYRSLITEKLWGIINLTGLENNIQAPLARSLQILLEQLSAHHDLPLMNVYHEDNIDEDWHSGSDNGSIGSLDIYMRNSDEPDRPGATPSITFFIHSCLNLFIDEEKGKWVREAASGKLQAARLKEKVRVASYL